MLALLTPLVKTTKLEISGNNEETKKDLAWKQDSRSISKKKGLRRNQEEVHEDQPATISKSFFPFSLSFSLS